MVRRKPRLLDLYCKAGGCSAGYVKAGFEVVGVDINPQPNYPYEFIQANALEILKDTEFVSQFDVIAASPPCQKYTRAQKLAQARNGGKYGDHLDLVPETRELLIATGKPYIIENVAGAPLLNPVRLYGSQFGLFTQRERWFESNILLLEPEQKPQKMQTPSAGNGIGPDGSISICGSGGVRGLNAKQITLYWGFAMGGIDWMTRAELAEAIPPAYTEFLGKQLKEHILVTV